MSGGSIRVAGAIAVRASLFRLEGLGSTLAKSPRSKETSEIRYAVPVGHYADYRQAATLGAVKSPWQDQRRNSTDAAVWKKKAVGRVDYIGVGFAHVRAQLKFD
jgi:hypothetical protein